MAFSNVVALTAHHKQLPSVIDSAHNRSGALRGRQPPARSQNLPPSGINENDGPGWRPQMTHANDNGAVATAFGVEQGLYLSQRKGADFFRRRSKESGILSCQLLQGFFEWSGAALE